MDCKNCGHIVEGKFCSNCGQDSNVSRINFPNFLKEVSESIFQVDKGFFYTLKELSLRPGYSLMEFINGKRKNHFKPIAYVLTLSTIYFLITQFTNQNTWLDDLITGWMLGATDKSSEAEIPSITIWFSKNFAYTTLLLLPVFSLASYLSFYKLGKNYLEHIVLNSYITGQQALFYSFFTMVGTTVENDVIEVFPLPLATLYTFWVFWQFFSEGNRMVNILRSISTYVLYLIFCTILLAVLLVIAEL